MALRVSWGTASPFRLAVDGVMDGAVALERRSRGRRPPELEEREESRLDMLLLRRASGDEPMMSSSESEA